MMVDGKWIDNISCRRCKQRHPESLSCAEAKYHAEKGRERLASLHADIDSRTFPELSNEERYRRALIEIHAWLVCAAIAPAEDMAQSFPEMEQVARQALYPDE